MNQITTREPSPTMMAGTGKQYELRQDGWLSLVAAILIQAVTDYREAKGDRAPVVRRAITRWLKTERAELFLDVLGTSREVFTARLRATVKPPKTRRRGKR